MSLFHAQVRVFAEVVDSGKPLSTSDLVYAAGADRVERYQAALKQAKADRREALKYPELSGDTATYWTSAKAAFAAHRALRSAPKYKFTDAQLRKESTGVISKKDKAFQERVAKWRAKQKAVATQVEAAYEAFSLVPKSDHKLFTIWHPFDTKVSTILTSGDPEWDEMEYPLPKLKTNLQLYPQPHLEDPVGFLQRELLQEVLCPDGPGIALVDIRALLARGQAMRSRIHQD